MEITKDCYKTEHMKFRSFIKKHPFELECYVYALFDPTKKQVFYVGKGQKERMFSHVFESFSNKPIDERQVGEKIERIKRIHDAGHKVEMYILHYGLTNEHAFIVESVLIDVFSNFTAIDTQAIGELTNSISGFDHRRGFCNVDTIVKTAEAKEKISINRDEKILAIRISGTETSDQMIYERVRKFWRINPARANKATYIAACRNGVVVGLYVNDSGWIQNSGSQNQKDADRYCFEGHPVQDETVRKRFIGRLIEIPKGARYPIMYVGGWR